jgi:hypothetical protein
MGQGGGGPGATDLSLYKSQLEGWLEDGAFWEDRSRYVRDWSQELYGDVRNYAVTGAPLAIRSDLLNDYLQHQLLHGRLGGEATAAARSFLESAYSPLANAAWNGTSASAPVGTRALASGRGSVLPWTALGSGGPISSSRDSGSAAGTSAGSDPLLNSSATERPRRRRSP